jgi:CRISPR/Cas system-associated endoribonuclease Cas2
MRIQKSVYELQGDEKEVMSFMLKAESIIDKKTDVVSLFPLCKDDFGKRELFGQLQRHSEIPPLLLKI